MPITRLHETLLGTTPSEKQQSLYTDPHYRGWLDGDESPEKFLAVFIRALYQACPSDGVNFQRSFLLLPPNHEAWAVTRMRVLSRHMLTRHAGNPLTYKLICKLLTEVILGTRVLQMEEPVRWVAFGFGPDCNTPTWLRQHLIGVVTPDG